MDDGQHGRFGPLVLRVGASVPDGPPWLPGNTHGWHPELGHMVISGYDRITAAETSMHRVGRIEMRLGVFDERLLVLFTRYDGGRWMDAPWGWSPAMSDWTRDRLVAEADATVPDDPDRGVGFTFVAFDSATRRVAALRAIGTSREFSRTLADLLHGVADDPLSADRFEGLVGRYHSRFPRPHDAVRKLSRVSYVSGTGGPT